MVVIKNFIQIAKNYAKIFVRLRNGCKACAKAISDFVINSYDWSEIKGEPMNLKVANLKKLYLPELFAYSSQVKKVSREDRILFTIHSQKKK
jgi:hypothetical protein